MRLVAARRSPPERSAPPVHVLPICPRPYSQESARSWLTRVGRVYALNPERLVGILGLVPFEPGSRRYLAQPIEAALDGSNLDQLALAAQLPPARLVEMRPDPVEWTLTHTEVCGLRAVLGRGSLPWPRSLSASRVATIAAHFLLAPCGAPAYLPNGRDKGHGIGHGRDRTNR
jgi:hypothetical protein